MESTVKRHEKIRDFILYEVMVARFTAYHCVCMQMQQTQKQLKSVPQGERYELLMRWKVIIILITYGIRQNEIVGRVLLGSRVISLSAITFFTNSNVC